jgi:hypothetical protein
LEEFQYNDSCVIKITGKDTKLIRPENMLEEIKKYVDQGRSSGGSNTKRINEIISFLSEGTNEHAQ